MSLKSCVTNAIFKGKSHYISLLQPSVTVAKGKYHFPFLTVTDSCKEVNFMGFSHYIYAKELTHVLPYEFGQKRGWFNVSFVKVESHNPKFHSEPLSGNKFYSIILNICYYLLLFCCKRYWEGWIIVFGLLPPLLSVIVSIWHPPFVSECQHQLAVDNISFWKKKKKPNR